MNQTHFNLLLITAVGEPRMETENRIAIMFLIVEITFGEGNGMYVKSFIWTVPESHENMFILISN
jgi:hypothetical protein